MEAKTPLTWPGAGGLERWDVLKTLLPLPSKVVNVLSLFALRTLLTREERRSGGPVKGGFDRLVSRRVDCLRFLIATQGGQV